jgi:hypothetical protein
MPVVPGDEVGCRVRAAEILTGNPEVRVDGHADRVVGDVIALQQPPAADVPSQLARPQQRKRACSVVLSCARRTELIF